MAGGDNEWWEGRTTIGVYKIKSPFKYKYVGDYLRDMREGRLDPKKEVIDDTLVYLWDDFDESWHVDDAWSETENTDTWILLPRRVYLVVRVKKDLGETKYHVAAYCYKVDKDGDAMKLNAADFYAKSRDEGLDRAKTIDCEELFMKERRKVR